MVFQMLFGIFMNVDAEAVKSKVNGEDNEHRNVVTKSAHSKTLLGPLSLE